MGHVVGLVQALFPRDTVLTIEGVVIQDVEHPKIRCDTGILTDSLRFSSKPLYHTRYPSNGLSSL